MKIAIDYSLADEHIGGMSVLVKSLVKNLKEVGSKNDFLVFKNKYGFNKKDTLSKILSALRQHLWYQTQLPLELKNQKVDMLYMPNPPVPLFYSEPIILTIPDMAFYYENINPLVKSYLFLSYFLSARKASKIITISNHSKADIVNIIKVNPTKVVVVPLAIEDEFYNKKISLKTIQKTLHKYHINKQYILCDPGSFMPRKNTKALIEALANIPKKYDLSVVLVGNNKGSDFNKLNKYIHELKLDSKIIFTGYVSVKEKVHLYKKAAIHVYPSLYEGFGLPPLQAMSMGIPSIVYNKTSLPEVVDGAGIKVENPTELAKSIINLLEDQRKYKNLVSKGLRRAKKFNWKITVRKFNMVFDSLNTSHSSS